LSRKIFALFLAAITIGFLSNYTVTEDVDNTVAVEISVISGVISSGQQVVVNVSTADGHGSALGQFQYYSCCQFFCNNNRGGT